jgi:hypothetical protein
MVTPVQFMLSLYCESSVNAILCFMYDSPTKVLLLDSKEMLSKIITIMNWFLRVCRRTWDLTFSTGRRSGHELGWW